MEKRKHWDEAGCITCEERLKVVAIVKRRPKNGDKTHQKESENIAFGPAGEQHNVGCSKRRRGERTRGGLWKKRRS